MITAADLLLERLPKRLTVDRADLAELSELRWVRPAMMTYNRQRPSKNLLIVAALFAGVLLCAGCPGSHEKHTGGDQKHLYPSEKAKKPGDEETIPTPGGASGGAAGSQSSSEKKSNPTNPDQPASR